MSEDKYPSILSPNGGYCLFIAMELSLAVTPLIAELQRAKRASEAPWVRKIGNPSS